MAKKDSISFVFEINCLKRGCQVLSFLFLFTQIAAFLPSKLRSQLPCRKSLELVKETQGPAPTGLNTTSCLSVMPQQTHALSGELLSSHCGFSSPFPQDVSLKGPRTGCCHDKDKGGVSRLSGSVPVCTPWCCLLLIKVHACVVSARSHHLLVLPPLLLTDPGDACRATLTH